MKLNCWVGEALGAGVVLGAGVLLGGNGVVVAGSSVEVGLAGTTVFAGKGVALGGGAVGVGTLSMQAERMVGAMSAAARISALEMLVGKECKRIVSSKKGLTARDFCNHWAINTPWDLWIRMHPCDLSRVCRNFFNSITYSSEVL